MKVYVVMQDVPYDSCDPMAIFADKGMAEAFAEEQRHDRFNGANWIYSIEEFDLIESHS